MCNQDNKPEVMKGYWPILMCSWTLLARIFSPVIGDTIYCSAPVSGWTERAEIQMEKKINYIIKNENERALIAKA